MEKTDIEKIMNVVDHTLLKPYAKEKEIKKSLSF